MPKNYLEDCQSHIRPPYTSKEHERYHPSRIPEKETAKPKPPKITKHVRLLANKHQAELVVVAELFDVVAFDEVADFVDVADFADVVDFFDVDPDAESGAHLVSMPLFEPLPHQRETRGNPVGSSVAFLRRGSQK
jgi:hypothetical protein